MLTPRLSSFALQHSQMKKLFFSSLSRRPSSVALLPGRPTLGFGYPLDECSFSLSTLGSLFQPPTLLGFPSRSFAPPSRSKKSFLFLSPFWHFPSKPFQASTRCSNGFSPAMEAVPLLASGWIRSGRGPDSLRALDLSGSPPSFASRKHLSSRMFPLKVFSSHSLRSRFDSFSGPLSSLRPGFSHLRAPACLAFLPFILTHFLNPQPPRTIFSSRRALFSYPKSLSSLCGRRTLS